MTAVEFAPDGKGPFLEADGKSRRALNWFFGRKERLFWLLQCGGWCGYFVFHVVLVSSLVSGTLMSAEAIAFSLSSSLIGFLTTTIVLRPVLRFARRQQPGSLLTVAFSGTLALCVAMAGVKALIFMQIFGDAWIQNRIEQLGTDNFLMLLVPDLMPNLFLLGSWGGFYFGFNYYLTLRDESERAIRSARLAEQAQLKMLRYQLNPHFLFNTLNAISTLVLTKDGEHANEMLTKLSAFLRYSLDSDPLQTTTLAEELRALELYLDIEATRFGERLRIVKEMDEEALGASVPSLILQPAIENAIKYAIGSMESGGEIKIVAKRQGDTLVLQVCDNGPNAPNDPELLLATASNGVGLANMRERLAHLYGPTQSFSLSRRTPNGLCVTLKLPFETRSRIP
ncbi:MAG: sensor histidine kinase [Alphaproteobacteria bacterium]|nr:sensor histidine kinase [Alphaproteobacteria bacterium]